MRRLDRRHILGTIGSLATLAALPARTAAALADDTRPDRGAVLPFDPAARHRQRPGPDRRAVRAAPPARSCTSRAACSTPNGQPGPGRPDRDLAVRRARRLPPHPATAARRPIPTSRASARFRDRPRRRYRFRTIKPVPYPGRTAHIHFKILSPDFAPLTTQMYIAGQPLNARDAIYQSIGDPAARAAVTVPLEPAPGLEPDALRANFEIVLGLIDLSPPVSPATPSAPGQGSAEGAERQSRGRYRPHPRRPSRLPARSSWARAAADDLRWTFAVAPAKKPIPVPVPTATPGLEP